MTGALPMRLRCSCSRSCSLARMSSFEISSAVPWPGCLRAGPPELGWAVFAVLAVRRGAFSVYLVLIDIWPAKS